MSAPARSGRHGTVDLRRFNNSWYNPGRGLGTRALWLVANRVFMQSRFPWPSRVKSLALRAFGATVGRGVVLKNAINIKYPWNLTIGDNTWVGEGVWIDSLTQVTIGSHCCLSQGAMIETGNHDWTQHAFDLKLGTVVVEDGAWAAVKSLMLPGTRLRSHAVLGAGAVLTGDTDPYGIYAGNPAQKVRTRVIGKSE